MPLFAPVDVYRLYLPSDVTQKYQGKFKIIGFLHIVIGTICIVIEAGAIVFFINRMNYYPSVAPGIWAGILFFVSGLFSVASGATGKYVYIIPGMVFAGVSILGSAVVVSCNAYFAKIFLAERAKPIAITIADEDTKLIPPLLILIAAAFCEFFVSIIHIGIASATTQICFCCVRKRELKESDIRLNYPHPRPMVTTISSAVTRADSFQYQGPYDTVTTQVYPTYTRRMFAV